MKLVTFDITTQLGRVSRVGAWLGDSPDQGQVIDLNAAYAAWLANQGEPCPQVLANATVPADMLTFIQYGKRALEGARQALADLPEGSEAQAPTGVDGATLVFDHTQVTLKTPLANPPMLRDFMAFERHTQTAWAIRKEPVPEAWYEMPLYYKGNPYQLIGHNQPVVWPHYSQKLDYEMEWACIIGTSGTNITAEDAHQHIFGYALLNDYSARDIQGKEMAGRLGPAKGKDFATAIGPWIVTADEIPDPHSLTIEATVNGEPWSLGRTGETYWPFEKMIAHASMCETLLPGDVLGSGTISGSQGQGCGLELRKWIQPGDVMSLSGGVLGTLTNRITSTA
jgi:2-keto-4-pentenoate hydratase/2-oxohepta-3-ene-1,7-dioic acid hydratase in catechol pathway